VASLIINQASLDVIEELGTFLAAAIKHLEPDVIVGLPTLGLSPASVVARVLNHSPSRTSTLWKEVNLNIFP